MSRSVCKNCGHDSEACDFEETLRRAIEMIAFKKIASNAMLQRELKIGYATSSKIIDQLEEEGLIGPAVGTEPRMISPKLFSLVENATRKENLLTCPMCQSNNIADIEYGMYEVTPELEKAEAEGRTVFAGCMMPKYVDEDGNEMTPEYHCNECLFEWENGKEQLGLYAEDEDYEEES